MREHRNPAPVAPGALDADTHLTDHRVMATHDAADAATHPRSASRRGPRIGQLLQVLFLFGLCLLLSPARAAQSNASTNRFLTSFQTFLARPPVVSELIFERVLATLPKDFDSEAEGKRWLQQRANAVAAAAGFTNYFFLRYQPGAFLLREIPDPHSLDSPTNRGAYFAGRADNLAWAIELDRVTFSSPAGDTQQPDPMDPIGAIVDGCERVAAEALTLGATGLRPGTFHWDGLQFQATTFGGSIAVGQLHLRPDGTPHMLSYSIDSNRPPLSVTYLYHGNRASSLELPSVFELKTGPNALRGTRYRIWSMRTSPTALPLADFLPTPFVLPTDTLFAYTNGTLLTFHGGSWVPVPTAPSMPANTSTIVIARALIIVLVLLPVLWFVRTLYTRKRRRGTTKDFQS